MQDFYYKFQIVKYDPQKADLADITISVIPFKPDFNGNRIFQARKNNISAVPIMNLDLYIDKNGTRKAIQSADVVIKVTISREFLLTFKPLKGIQKLNLFMYDDKAEIWEPIKKGKGIQNSQKLGNEDAFEFYIDSWPIDDRMIGTN